MRYSSGPRSRAPLPVLAFAFCAGLSGAQESPCDPELSGAPEIRWRYQSRGDRCEGLYARGLSANPELRVVGLSADPPRVDLRTVRGTLVRWNAGGAARVRIRATGLRSMQFYQMDAVRPGQGSPYVWPTAVLNGVGLQPQQVGLLAWVDDGAPEHARVHLPVRMDTASGMQPVAEYRLTVVPRSTLLELRYTLRRRAPDGGWVPVRTDIDAGEHRYRERQAAHVMLRPGEPGEYEIALTGRREHGGWVPARLRFRHGTEPF